jgi:GR25 family glycosyltransferase involved in LPS biosynthesis
MNDRGDWRTLFERTISAFYEGAFDEGRLACDLVLSDPETPEDIRVNARRNAVHYAPSLGDLVPGYQEWPVPIRLPDGWFGTNPSLIAHGDGYLLSVRCLNYAMPGWVMVPGERAYRSRTAIVPLDGAGVPSGPLRFLHESLASSEDEDDRYQGAEDVRLLQVGERLMASGSLSRRLGPERKRTICLGLFDVDLERGMLANPRWLSETPGTVEKNWMPAVRDGALHFVYGCGPTTVLRCDPETGEIAAAANQPAPRLAGDFRGGTQLLPDGDGWIALVHESAEWEPGKRTYLHRVVRFAADWRITHLSHPFRFHMENLEFAAGLARRDDHLLISFSVGDRECWVADVPAAGLLGLLRPVETFHETVHATESRTRLPQDRYSLQSASFRPNQLPATWDELLASPVFIVNLDRRPDRLALAVDQVRRAGFRDIRRVRAIDGLDPAMLDRAWAAVGRPAMHPGEPLFALQPGRQGCFLSMTLLLRWIVERAIPLAVVFEDDPMFHSGWAQIGPAFHAQTPRDLDMLYLGGQAELWDPADPALPTADTLPPLRAATDWRAEPAVLRTPTYKLGAFVITLNGAKKALARIFASPGGVYAIDNMMNHFQREALAGVPGSDFAWAIWNATAQPDPALEWLPAQTDGETGMVFQHLELGTDIDKRWLAYSEPTVHSAREQARAIGRTIPPEISEQVETMMRDQQPTALPVVELLPSPVQLTLVSVLIHLERSSVDPAGRIALLEPLFAAGMPLVLYVDQWYRERIDPATVPPWVTLQSLKLDETAAWQEIVRRPEPPRLPAIRTETKDTVEFIALQIAKTEVVARAVRDGLVRTPFAAFVDSGIAKLFADRPAAFSRLASADLTGLDQVLVPGCWSIRPLTVDQLVDRVAWVMCGSMFIVPASMAEEFDQLSLETLGEFLAQGRLAWEVNVWALLAGRRPELFHWYEADHNDRLTMIPSVGSPSADVTKPASSMLPSDRDQSTGSKDSWSEHDSIVYPAPVPAREFRLGGPWPRTWEDAVLAPAFIVNLDRRPDRLAWTTSRVREAGFRNVRRVRAIDGRDPGMLARAWARVGNPPFHAGEPLFAEQPGRQGCFLSMTVLLRWIVEREIPLATIFEDDALFHSRWHELAPVFYAETPRDIDLLCLGGFAEQWEPGDGAEQLPTADWLPPLRGAGAAPDRPRVLRTPTYKLGAFMITLDGARKLLAGIDRSEGGVYAIDNMVNHLQRRAMTGVDGEALAWATWNATAIPDPTHAWLPAQTEDEHGLVFQQTELGSDVDPAHAEQLAVQTEEARVRAALVGRSVPNRPTEGAPAISPKLHGIDLFTVALANDVLPATAPGNGSLTLVTVLVLLPNSNMAPEWRSAMLWELIDSRIPLVLYLDRHYRDLFAGTEWPSWVRVRDIELDELESARRVANSSNHPRPYTFAVNTNAESFLVLYNAKIELIARAVREGLVDTPVVAFIDSGVSKLFGDWQAAFARLRTADLSALDRVLIPGPWEPTPCALKSLVDFNNWTFAGNIVIVPSRMAEHLQELNGATFQEFLDNGCIPLEANVWTLMRHRYPDFISWYFGDHDESMTELPREESGWASPRQGMKMSMPNYWMFEERSIHAFYEGGLEQGRVACELLLNHPHAPDNIRRNARLNSVYYAPLLQELLPSYQEWGMNLPNEEAQRIVRPRLIDHGGGALLTAVWQVVSKNGPADAARVRIAIVDSGGQLGWLPEAWWVNPQPDGGPAKRIEDFFLIQSGDGLTGIEVAISLIGDAHEEQVLQVADVDSSLNRVTGVRSFLVPSDLPLRQEATVVSEEKRTGLLLGFRPIVTGYINSQTGVVYSGVTHKAPAQLDNITGSSTLMRLDDGWIALVQETVNWPDGGQASLHRLARFDAGFAVTHLSFPFRIGGHAKEIATGLVRWSSSSLHSSQDGQCLIAFCVNEQEIRGATAPLTELIGLLEPVARFGWMGPEDQDVRPQSGLYARSGRPRTSWPSLPSTMDLQQLTGEVVSAAGTF